MFPVEWVIDGWKELAYINNPFGTFGVACQAITDSLNP